MTQYTVLIRKDGKLSEYDIEAPSFTQAAAMAVRENGGGTIADILPLGDTPDIVEIG